MLFLKFILVLLFWLNVINVKLGNFIFLGGQHFCKKSLKMLKQSLVIHSGHLDEILFYLVNVIKYNKGFVLSEFLVVEQSLRA